jgi:hypothetical protein
MHNKHMLIVATIYFYMYLLKKTHTNKLHLVNILDKKSGFAAFLSKTKLRNLEGKFP